MPAMGGDQWRKQVFHKCRDDSTGSGADHHADGHINDVAAENEFTKSLEHGGLLVIALVNWQEITDRKNIWA